MSSRYLHGIAMMGFWSPSLNLKDGHQYIYKYTKLVYVYIYSVFAHVLYYLLEICLLP